MADAGDIEMLNGENPDMDQDLLLARILQDQERAFHALMSHSLQTGGSSLPNSSHYAPDESASMSDAELDDEELARRLQSEEVQQAYQQQQQPEGPAASDLEFDEDDDLDYDQLGYEDLTALGDVAGKVSKGLQGDSIAQLPLLRVKDIKQQQQQPSQQQGHQEYCGSEQAQQQLMLAAKAHQACNMCAVCQMEYDDDEQLRLLPCCHIYHQQCIDQWLALSKACPICSKEVSGSDSKSKMGHTPMISAAAVATKHTAASLAALSDAAAPADTVGNQ